MLYKVQFAYSSKTMLHFYVTSFLFFLTYNTFYLLSEYKKSVKIKKPLMLHIKRKPPKSPPLKHDALAPVPVSKLSGHSCACQLRL